MVNILAIISDYMYVAKIHSIIEDSIETYSKILYVSLNKTFKSIAEEFKHDNLDIAKFMFIDTITSTIIQPPQTSNCIFLSSANDTKKLYSSIIKLAKENKIEMVIFDSLSSLTAYKNFDEIVAFFTTLLGSLAVLNVPAVFTCLKSDENTYLINHLKMNVDKCYELS